jgi:Trk K+ transport system NAD-binding subunit
VDFLDLSLPNSRVEIDLEEIRVGESSELVGLSVSELEGQASQLRIIALKRHDGDIELVPEPTTRIAPQTTSS